MSKAVYKSSLKVNDVKGRQEKVVTGKRYQRQPTKVLTEYHISDVVVQNGYHMRNEKINYELTGS
ncbi:hypothetical protein CHS0354_020911 [Potamilus streckersoni]|uniref:Uncharacterized protein n=1 Tax=Potamilus streckersoni TaxID=2493646 RepID=A0AAE0W3E1_9BIVA|nr:hypothetical protein CHS0354_020911 [Potamilus streckersoni]